MNCKSLIASGFVLMTLAPSAAAQTCQTTSPSQRYAFGWRLDGLRPERQRPPRQHFAAVITSIADDPHYAAPPAVAEPPLTKYEKPPRWSEKLIRRTLGKDRKHTAKLRDQFAYAATVRRIERGGV